jgi:hypothetical protein
MHGQGRGSLGNGRNELSTPSELAAATTGPASRTVVFGVYVIGESQVSPWSAELLYELAAHHLALAPLGA